MQVMKQTVHVGLNRQACIRVPRSYGELVEVIVLSVPEDRQSQTIFECVGEDGVKHRLIDWTEDHFCTESLLGITKEDDTVVEDIFGSENHPPADCKTEQITTA